MATKPRYRKTALQLWIGDKRRELGLTTADIAALTNVGEATARGWESRGRPSEEALAALERRFGELAPSEPTENYTELAEVLSAFIEELAQMRVEREAWTRGVVEVLRAFGQGQVPRELLDALEPPPHESAPRALRETTGSK